jgi:surfeit locus 1 family protein
MEGGQVERPEGEVTVSGYARPTEHNPLAATDDPAHRRFYTFDARAIAAALGAPDALPQALAVVLPRAGNAAPSGLGAAPPPARGPLPDPAPSFPEPSNPHLGYAITWLSLAAIWVVIFLLWSRKRLRET